MDLHFVLRDKHVKKCCFPPFCLCSRDILPAIRKTRRAKDVVSGAASELGAVGLPSGR